MVIGLVFPLVVLVVLGLLELQVLVGLLELQVLVGLLELPVLMVQDQVEHLV